MNEAVMKELANKKKGGFKLLFTGDYLGFLDLCKEVSLKYSNGSLNYKELNQNAEADKLNAYIIKEDDFKINHFNSFLKMLNDDINDETQLIVFIEDSLLLEYPEITKRFCNKYFIRKTTQKD